MPCLYSNPQDSEGGWGLKGWRGLTSCSSVFHSVTSARSAFSVAHDFSNFCSSTANCSLEMPTTHDTHPQAHTYVYKYEHEGITWHY